MNDMLDVLNSTLTSTLRFWRGTNARAAAKLVPTLVRKKDTPAPGRGISCRRPCAA